MRSKNVPIRWRALLAILTTSLLLTNAWAATEKLVHNFGSGTDGTIPYSALISDSAGNFYGTTASGGSYNSGTVFELSPNGSGGWTEKRLHNFRNNGIDGVGPSASLVMDAAGNLYGTTYSGGDYGAGTVFKLTPNGSGGWTETKLRNFYNNGTDGAYPRGGVIFDANGNLYGATYFGGNYGVGMVFELTPAHGETWAETKLHNFRDNGTDGWGPSTSLIFDGHGNLYGVTAYGGHFNSGTVFRLEAKSGGGFIYSVLHSFSYSNTDGGVPLGGLIFDAAGNLYGTTLQGGNHGGGTVVELTIVNHQWTEQVLRNFGNGTDGAFPLAGVVLDSASPPNVYGTTYAGGIYPCGGLGCGIVFKLTPPSGGGNWTENVLYNFGINGLDAIHPYTSLIFDAAGNLYGTSRAGGSHSDGTIFEITP